MSKRILTMLTLGVAAVAVAGFSLPAEGGLFDFFHHRRHHRGYHAACACPPACAPVACAPLACAPVYQTYSPPPPACGVCAYPPPVHRGYGHGFGDFDDDDWGDWDDDDWGGDWDD